jgi:hypothetical protein
MKTTAETRYFTPMSSEGGYIDDMEFAKLLYGNFDKATYTYGGAPSVINQVTDTSCVLYRYAGNSNQYAVWLDTDSDGNLTGRVWFGDAYFSEGSVTIQKAVETVHCIDEKFIPDTIARSSDIAKANWSQNDENAIDYVKNRTHWVEDLTEVREYSWTLDNSGGWMSGTDLEFAMLFHENYRNSILIGLDTYVEDITGTSSYEPDNCYTYVFKRSNNNGAKIYVRLYHNNDALTGEYSVGENTASWGTETIAIPYNNEVVHPLDEKFIPDTIARSSDIAKADWN